MTGTVVLDKINMSMNKVRIKQLEEDRTTTESELKQLS